MEARTTAVGGGRAEIEAAYSDGNLAGIEFDDSRRTARLSRQHSLEKLRHPKAPAFCLMEVKLSAAEAAELRISSEDCHSNLDCTRPEDSVFWKAFVSVHGL